MACAIDTYTIGACSAAVVRVRAPRASVDATAVALEPLMDLADDNRYCSIPAVCAPVHDVCCVAVVNPSNSEVVIPAGAPVSEVIPISATLADVSSAAVTPQLSHEAKLRKVLHELQIDMLADSVQHKRPLVSLVAEYLDVFAESDSDVGTTGLTFHEIDTGDTRPLHQPVRRLPYGEMRRAVESEIEKLTDAEIARPSMSPWASPVVMVRKKDGS